MFSDDLFYQKNTFKCPSKISQAVIYQYVIPFQYMGVITSAISGRVTSRKANYLPSYVPKIIELVNCYHDYDKPKNKLLQLLMEADLIVNCYENRPDYKKAEYIKKIFQTDGGKELLALCLKKEME